MYRIVKKISLNPTVTEMWIEAPLVAKKARPGQFIILRVSQDGERIPLTVAGTDAEAGTVRIIFQVVGATTTLLNAKEEGQALADFVGPLGEPTAMGSEKRVCVIGGGVGCAIALPVAAEFARRGTEVTSIIGFRSSSLLILEKDFRAFSTSLSVMTDDGSYGEQGRVDKALLDKLGAGEHFDRIVAIGPLVMMRAVVAAAKPFGIPVTVSMNPIMIDGTGMCGGCRLTLLRDGKRITKFACVDGPDFDGYEVDFDEAIYRTRTYLSDEKRAFDAACHLLNRE